MPGVRKIWFFLMLLAVAVVPVGLVVAAEPPVDLLAGSVWQYSTDGGGTFSPERATVKPGQKAEVIARIEFTCAKPDELADLLGESTAAAVVDVVGRTAVLYRPNPALPQAKRIKLE